MPETGRPSERPPTPAAGFELTDHTADVGVRAWGPDVDAVFEQAALALVSLLYDPAAVEERRQYPLDVDADDAELLLAAWLNEVLYHVDGLRELFAGFRVRVVGQAPDEGPEPSCAGWRLRAVAGGEGFDPEHHRVTPTVKAATLHGLSLRRTPAGWEGRVLLDV
jgi:tRNA nucleotidyltransferase (CCA-adding enzyme)